MTQIFELRFWQYGLIATLGAVFLVSGATAVFAQSDDQVDVDGKRLVTIYDQQSEQTILTEARTVGEAIESADIDLHDLDAVEPARGDELTAKSYQVNIYRARPITVVDGQRRVQITTAAQSPMQIAEQANIDMYPEDEADFGRSNDVLTQGGAGLRMTIDRATNFTLVLYGKSIESRSQAATVGEMMDEKGIELGDKDGVSVNRDAPLTEGATVRVWRDGKETVTNTETVKFKVETIQDTSKDIGFREVRTAGVLGSKEVTYEIETRNGREVSRKKINEVVTKKSSKEVVVVGAKRPVVTGSKNDWMQAVGIPESQRWATDLLIQKESGWNPNAVNPSSGACGLGQQLPCGKWAGTWNDPIDGLRGANGYVIGRYGSWEAAWAHSQANGWY